MFGSDLKGITVALLGLTYKPGTSTLRRSLAVELGGEISRAGGCVRAYDPALSVAPADLPPTITLCGDVHSALAGADAAVVATAWPEIARLGPDELVQAMKTPRLLDADGVLAPACRSDPRVAYYCVGSTA
jgi:UDPglucose 6-dehydrogenase